MVNSITKRTRERFDYAQDKLTTDDDNSTKAKYKKNSEQRNKEENIE